MDYLKIKRAIEGYCKEFRRNDLPPLQVLEGLYDLFPDRGGRLDAVFAWPSTYKQNGAGVYCLFDARGALLYIGKASMGSNLGFRLNKYFQYQKDGSKNCRFIKEDWLVEPEYLMTIEVPRGIEFEAASLEEYLIRKLNPPQNKQGKSKN